MKSIIEFDSKEVLDTQIEGIVAAVKQCSVKSENGGIIPSGTKVYRGDSRDIGQLENDKGFYPSSILKENEKYTEHAIGQINVIMHMEDTPQDFIHKWKYSMNEDWGVLEKVVKGYKGRLAGVCCGFNTGQKGGKEYCITLPALYAVKAVRDGNNAICFYADNPLLEKSSSIWMHLCNIGNSEEFVSLTPVPMSWIKEIKKKGGYYND